jgi:hypothetical protein
MMPWWRAGDDNRPHEPAWAWALACWCVDRAAAQLPETDVAASRLALYQDILTDARLTWRGPAVVCRRWRARYAALDTREETC